MKHRPWCATHYSRLLVYGDIQEDKPVKVRGAPMGTVPCSVPGCRNASRTRGWCHAHYRRWRQAGDVESTVELRLVGGPAEVRFWAKVNRDGPVPEDGAELGPCYLWTAPLNSSGYGVFKLGDTVMGAHHAGWLIDGAEPLPDGHVLDHLCRVRHCVRRSHLEPVTQLVNIRRGSSQPARNGRKTACVNGHPFDEANTYRNKLGRKCRECAREKMALRRARLRPERDGRGSRLAFDDDLAKRVGEVYRFALAAGEPPVVAVGRHFARSQRAAANLCRFARSRGLLAPSTKKTPQPLPVAKWTIYFVERQGFIKIGTTANLGQRLQSLQNHIPRVPGMTAGPVNLLATMPGGRSVERELHRRFAHIRAGGEWFRPDAELDAVVRALADGAIPELALAVFVS